jgi:hypothetical protein
MGRPHSSPFRRAGVSFCARATQERAARHVIVRLERSKHGNGKGLQSAQPRGRTRRQRACGGAAGNPAAKAGLETAKHLIGLAGKELKDAAKDEAVDQATDAAKKYIDESRKRLEAIKHEAQQEIKRLSRARGKAGGRAIRSYQYQSRTIRARQRQRRTIRAHQR